LMWPETEGGVVFNSLAAFLTLPVLATVTKVFKW